MDLIRQLAGFASAFKRRRIQHALLGGAALGAYGIGRSTFDLDFLVLGKDLPKLDRLLAGMGYDLVFRSDNVSHFAPKKGGPGLDFLHAFRVHSMEALGRAKDYPLGGRASVKVLAMEDIIGFKLQAVANDSTRKQRDMADIEEICRVHGPGLDWGLVREYFALFKMKAVGAKLEARYGKADQR